MGAFKFRAIALTKENHRILDNMNLRVILIRAGDPTIYITGPPGSAFVGIARDFLSRSR